MLACAASDRLDPRGLHPPTEAVDYLTNSCRYRAEAGQPELILMDMSLPVLDGWEVARRLKASHTTAHIPIIALTAHVMSGDREKALAAGCNDYDVKPVEFDRLLLKIEALLKKP